MGIELKCPQCQKLIRAPNDAGGRRGKCPYCKKSIYIPIPADEGEEEIGIAPLDADEERQAAELRQETIRFAAGVDRADPGSPNDIAGETGPETDIRADVESFLTAARFQAGRRRSNSEEPAARPWQDARLCSECVGR